MDSFCEYLNKLFNSSQPSHQEKSLEENMSLLKKNLCTKDEIIKKLVETQSTVLNTISTKANNQHSNTQNQSSPSLSSNSLNDTKQLAKQLYNTKQLASQEQEHPPIARPCSSELQEIPHSIQTHQQRSERNIAMKNIYLGNLPEDINKQDIFELFGLNSTPYLRDTCNIDFPINNKTGKFRSFAFIRARHILQMNLSNLMISHTMIKS